MQNFLAFNFFSFFWNCIFVVAVIVFMVVTFTFQCGNGAMSVFTQKTFFFRRLKITIKRTNLKPRKFSVFLRTNLECDLFIRVKNEFIHEQSTHNTYFLAILIVVNLSPQKIGIAFHIALILEWCFFPFSLSAI